MLADDIIEGALQALFSCDRVEAAGSTAAPAEPFFPMPNSDLVETPLIKSARTSKSSVGEEGPAFTAGCVVFAHKGQQIAFWRPGVVLKIKPKNHYLIKFFGDLVEHDCTKQNMMPFCDYENKRKRSKGSKLFIIPEEKSKFFERCLEDAQRKISSI